MKNCWGVDRVYTIGFVWQGRHLGGTTILTRGDLSSKKDAIEMIMDQAAITVNRIRVEAALRKSEEKYRLIAENMADVITTTDMKLRFTYVSPSIIRLRGFTAEEAMTQTIDQIMTPDSFQRVSKTFEEELQLESAGTADPARSRILVSEEYKKDGSIAWVENTVSFIRDNEQKAVGILVVSRDVTERKTIEEQLFQAQKMESVGRLAGGVAHDFNNMLGVIIGHAEMALDQADMTQPIHGDLLEIQKAAQRSANLTRQLLAFARRQTASPVVLDLNETISGIFNMLRRLIGENIDLEWKPGPGLWAIKIDPVQVDQILANLLVNARDAIAGVGKVSIETKNQMIDDSYKESGTNFIPGPYAMISVSDSGTGIGKHDLEHIFEPFYTTKEVGKGTGLGLATVYGIVKQNNGFINVYSEPDKGTVFKIYLPKAADSISSPEEEIPRKKLNGSETILMVEDEKAVLKLGKSILGRYGYTVLDAQTPNAAIALAKSRREKIHLLITDVIMPEMNGKELMEILLDLHPEIKCLFMSGYTADAISHHGVIDKGVNFLQKPFSVKSLAEKVRELLDG